MVLFHTLRTAYYVLHGALAAPTVPSILHPAVTRIYVGLRACDVMMHVNNARYLEYFEFARWHHTARASHVLRFWDTGVYPVVGSVHLQYLRELKPLQFCEVHTKVVGAHKKSLLIEQRITTVDAKRHEEVVHAVALVKATFMRKGKAIDLGDAMRAYGLDEEEFKANFPWVQADGKPAVTGADAPVMSPFVAQYNEADDAWRMIIREERERARSGGAPPPPPGTF